MNKSSMNPMLLTLAGLSVGLFLSGCKTTGSGDGILSNPLKSTTEMIGDKAKSAKEKTILLTEDAANAAKDTAGKAGEAAKGAGKAVADKTGEAAGKAKGAAGKAVNAAKNAGGKAADAAKGGANKAGAEAKGAGAKGAADKLPPIAGKLDSLLKSYDEKLVGHQNKLKGAKAEARRELQTPIVLDLASFTTNWYSHASAIPEQLSLEQIKGYSKRFKTLSGKYDDLLSKLVAGQ